MALVVDLSQKESINDLKRFIDLYNKHEEFKELSYLGKLKFWLENDLIHFYVVELKNNPKKKDVTFSIIPNDKEENRLFNSAYMYWFCDLRLEKSKANLINKINLSPNPKLLIEQEIKRLNAEYSKYNGIEKNVNKEVNYFTAYWFGYQRVINVIDSPIDMDYYKFLTFANKFCNGMEDAYLLPFLKEQLNNLDKNKEDKTKDETILEIPENLKELLSIWHDKNDFENLNKIYKEHKSIFTDSTKKLISCFAYELYYKKWLMEFDNNTFNATDIAKIFLGMANLKFNPNYKSDFNFLVEKPSFNIKYSKKIKIDMKK